MRQAELGLNLSTKRTRKREFLEQVEQMEQMEHVVPWKQLEALIASLVPEGRRGRPPFAAQTMLRIHFTQLRFTLSDPAMEEAAHDVPLLRELAGLSHDSRLLDQSAI